MIFLFLLVTLEQFACSFILQAMAALGHLLEEAALFGDNIDLNPLCNFLVIFWGSIIPL